MKRIQFIPSYGPATAYAHRRYPSPTGFHLANHTRSNPRCAASHSHHPPTIHYPRPATCTLYDGPDVQFGKTVGGWPCRCGLQCQSCVLDMYPRSWVRDLARPCNSLEWGRDALGCGRGECRLRLGSWGLWLGGQGDARASLWRFPMMD